MKRIFLGAMLCAVLLCCGTAAGNGETPGRLSPTKETENDNLRCYPLDAADCRFFTFGTDLLVLRPTEDGAELLRCAGKGLTVTARTAVPRGSELSSDGTGICCYDPQTQRALLLSADLTLIETCSLPDAAGAPLLQGDKLYYTTADALMELDTGTMLHHLVRREENLTLTAVLPQSGLLVCGGEWESRYIRISDGTLEQRSSRVTQAAGWGSRVYLGVRWGFLDCLYLGQTMLPLCPAWKLLTFLPAKNAALVLREEQSLAIYDLTTGSCLAQRTLGKIQLPEDAWATEDGRVFFTSGGALYQWEPEWDAQRDSRVKITSVYTLENPDEKGLDQCRQRAALLESRLGLQVLLGADAAATAPKGVELEAEHIPSILLDTLASVESTLARFPEEVLEAAFSGGNHFYLCPVRSIRVEGEAVLSLQFWSGRDCYLLIAPSAEIGRGVIQAISPLLDRQVLMHSDAYDDWDGLNPPGFVYGTGDWDEAAFASLDCLESQGADRAGLLYAAMESGSRELFLGARLQNKLRALCRGLREAIPLPAGENPPWEQYLWKQ